MRTAALFIRPDGRYYLRVSMGGMPLVFREPVDHPAFQGLVDISPLVTHLEYVKTQPELFATAQGDAPRVVYVFRRALRQVGAQIDQRFHEVPLQEPV
jgi:hypothetical protein